MKIVVIGAGAAGLIAIKHTIDFGCEVIAFEQSDKIGGTWVYTDQIGRNEFGIDVHSSMYKNLTTNLPIEMMCYPNEPLPQNENSFVSSNIILNYYESFADKYNLFDHIKLLHHVIRVKPQSDDSWEVMVRNLRINKFETYIFDAVLVCNGHFHSGFIPKYEGRKIFQGKQIHSHGYRCAEAFKDDTILVVGGNFSAVDIVQQTARHAKSVTWSHHLKHEPDVKAFGHNVTQKPDVLKLNEKGVTFTDDTSAHFTTIIYCTGYKYDFPFLSVDCGISTCENFVSPLYKHCLNINRPSMGFIGLTNLHCPNQLFSLQSRFCLTFITERKQLPTKEEMVKDYEADMNQRWKLGLPKRKAHLLGPHFQEQYFIELATMANIEPIKPVMPRIHIYTNINRDRDFINFRHNKFYIIDDETFEVRPVK